MKYSEAKWGRTFVIRLEDGDILHESIEGFAGEHGIEAAALIVVGGADTGSKLIVGPEEGRQRPVNPMDYILPDVHEVSGAGTIFPNADGEPILHMHITCGRGDSTVTGCVRRGVKVWQVMELVLFEITQTTGKRLLDPATGFELLQPY